MNLVFFIYSYLDLLCFLDHIKFKHAHFDEENVKINEILQ